jgi:multimeric flavodoxin WrbA
MLTKKRKLLGVAASLRNARWGAGNEELIERLKQIPNEKELMDYLTQESELHLSNFLKAGREEEKSFLEIYKNLRANKGDKGLSNSEVALAAALWRAYQENVEIEHLSLAEYFLANGQNRNLPELREKILSADGLLVSGPVYFGDRGSLAQELIEMIKREPKLQEALKGKLYGGIAVGAKRNGGQETTLIYQMLDFVTLGMKAVGNDSETTSQYGGTGLAGDVGTMHKDSYGLKTSMGTGRRMAKIIRRDGYSKILKGPINILFVVLQDSDGYGLRKIRELIEPFGDEISFSILDVVSKKVIRCLACDICPTDIDLDEKYRCIINSNSDDFEEMHRELLGHDAIIPVTLSLKNSNDVVNNYQVFIERTRYLRRGDYVFSDWVTAPLSFEEIGVQEYYSIRMLTSMIRHHTVMLKPMVGHLYEGRVLNWDQLREDFKNLIKHTHGVVAARLAEIGESEASKYNPVGYVLSSDKDVEDERLNKRKDMLKDRECRMKNESNKRLGSMGVEV